MKHIPLTQNKFALVDECDYRDLNRFKWYARRCRDLFYASRKIQVNGNWATEQMHRRILNTQHGQEVDHLNHNGLDNRRENIRICTHGQNVANQKKRGCITSSDYRGISWRPETRTWRARITWDGEEMNLGCFDDEDDAAHAYDAASKEKFGEFAFLNFPERTQQ